MIPNGSGYTRRPTVRCTHPVAADAPAPTVYGTTWWQSMDALPARPGRTLINPAGRGGAR